MNAENISDRIEWNDYVIVIVSRGMTGSELTEIVSADRINVSVF